MPILIKTIPEVMTHILQPVADQMVAKLIRDMGCSDLFAKNDNIMVHLGDSSVSKTTDRFHNANLEKDMFVSDVSVQMNPINAKWDTTTFRHQTAFGLNKNTLHKQFPILSDPTAQIYIYETLAPCTLVFNCNLHFITKERAFDAVSALRSAFGDGSPMLLEDLVFDYPFNSEMLHVLYTLYSNYRAKPAGEEVRFKDYLLACSPIVSMNVSQNGKRAELIFKRSIRSATAILEFTEDKPSEDKQDQSVKAFDLKFMYTLQFSRPEINIMTFPVVVGNKLLGDDLIPKDETARPQFWKSEYPHIDINTYMKKNPVIRQIAPFKQPFYDDWIVPTKAPLRRLGYRPFLIMAATMDTNETVIDFKQGLGEGYYLAPKVIEWLTKQKQDSLTFSRLFNISVFANDTMIEPDFLSFTEDLVLTIRNQDPNKIYHIVFSEQCDLKNVIDEDIPGKIPEELDSLDPSLRKRYHYGYNLPLRVWHADIIVHSRPTTRR